MSFERSRATAALTVAVLLTAACASSSSIKPAEVLDERTGMTVGSLEKPIELVQATGGNLVVPAGTERRISFAYFGPVEWDNMGNVSYGLWVHVAPGNDWKFDDIRAPSTLTLSLADGTVALSIMEPPSLAHGPYQPLASWGQTAYFALDVALLRRMAASEKIELAVKAGTEQVRFSAAADARETLLRYLHARGY